MGDDYAFIKRFQQKTLDDNEGPIGGEEGHAQNIIHYYSLVIFDQETNSFG